VIWEAKALLFPEKKTGLVRLSDATKIGLHFCAETTAKVLAIYSQGEPHYSRAREIARRVEEGKVNADQADEQIRQILAIGANVLLLPGVLRQLVRLLSDKRH